MSNLGDPLSAFHRDSDGQLTPVDAGRKEPLTWPACCLGEACIGAACYDFETESLKEM